MSVSLYGRADELHRLDDALSRAAQGTVALAFIEGEPGIGKTTLLEGAVTRARERGFRVFAGRAEELEQDRPFRALAEALGCRTGTDDRRREIARLLGSEAGGEGASFRLIDDFEDLVEAEALAGPVLLAIDDLQWADAGTVRALGSIARRTTGLTLAIVATLRRTPRSDELAALLRGLPSQVTLISLLQLDGSAVEEMVRAQLGASPGPRLRAHIDGAGGNPFFIAELLDALRAESAITIAEGLAEIRSSLLPPSIVVTILRRLTGLTSHVLEILRSAAVLGTHFGIDELATAAGVSPGEAVAAVQTLRAEGVLTDEGEEVRFRHDLIREALYDDLGEPVRKSMHRRIGYALAETGADPLIVATHLVRGAGPGDKDAADWMIKAASNPMVDSRTVTVLLERALEIDPGHREEIWLVRRLARLLIWQGRPTEALPPLQRLLTDLSEVRDRLAVMEILASACTASRLWDEARSWMTQASTLARQLVDSDDPGTLLLASQSLFFVGEVEQATSLAERAAEITRGLEDRDEVEANNQSSWLLMLLGRPAEALAYSERALSLRASSAAAKALYWRHHACALGDLDRIDEAESALAVAQRIAEEEGLLGIQQSLLVERAQLRYSTGRWSDVALDVETAASIAEEFVTGGEPAPEGLVALIAHHRGEDGDQAPAEARELNGVVLRAVTAFDRGDIEEAGEAASVLSSFTGEVPRVRRWFDPVPALARIALAAGNTDAARTARDTLARIAQRASAPGIALADARCRAIVDRDVAAARHAVGLARSSPRALLAAGAYEDASEVLDRDEAVKALSDALDLYEQLGATRDRDRVAARLRELGVRAANAPARARAVSGWDALTAAELDVVRLAADGLTNREIGARLFVSHRTVATHLSHVFEKLGLRSRVELAREAMKHGLRASETGS